MNTKCVNNYVPDEFICPITLQIMVHPLMTRNGCNYERAAILNWLGEGNTYCPLTRNTLRLSDLIPNRALEMKIKFWREENQNNTAVACEDFDVPEESKFGVYGFLYTNKLQEATRITTNGAKVQRSSHHRFRLRSRRAMAA